MKIKHRKLNNGLKNFIRNKFIDKLLDSRNDVDLSDIDMDQMAEFIDSDDTLEFAVWIEVKDTELDTDIPITLSFATYLEDEVPVTRKWKDLDTITYSTDSTRSLRFLTGATDRISKNDLVALRNSSMRVFNSKGRQELVEDEGDIYWTEEI